MLMINRFLIVFLFFIFSPISSAHVQWFVAPDEMKDVYFSPDLFYFFITAFVLFFTVFSVFITNAKNKNKYLDLLISHNVNVSKQVLVTVFVVIQILFFSLQVIKGGFVAPNIVLPEKYATLGMISQLLVVVTASVSIALSGMFVLATTVLMISLTPLSIWINYAFEFFSIGIFMILCGGYISRVDVFFLGKDKLVTKEQQWNKALSVLRIGIGTQLAILALTEKLIFPGLAVVFVEMFPFYNIFPTLGLSDGTNMHFVYFVGLCELFLGLLLLFGTSNRLCMLMATFAFVTTAFIHGAHEVEGHLPIFASAFVLLVALRNERNISGRRFKLFPKTA